jgi:hypothetical protein
MLSVSLAQVRSYQKEAQLRLPIEVKVLTFFAPYSSFEIELNTGQLRLGGVQGHEN